MCVCCSLSYRLRDYNNHNERDNNGDDSGVDDDVHFSLDFNSTCYGWLNTHCAKGNVVERGLHK